MELKQWQLKMENIAYSDDDNYTCVVETPSGKRQFIYYLKAKSKCHNAVHYKCIKQQ